MCLVSVIIPTRNRPAWLPRAVASALDQAAPGILEIVVVDDGSDPPASLAPHAQLRLLRHPTNRGGAAARNTGLRAARGNWVLFLDDDDELLPDMIANGLCAIETSELPPPVASVSALEVVADAGRRIDLRLPPTLPKGSLWSLEPLPKGRSHLVKQSLLAPRDLLLRLGGFDENFDSRVHSDLFLRLNPTCSLVGVDEPGYRLYRHADARVSSNAALRRASFRRLIAKHRTAMMNRPHAFARLLLDHAEQCGRAGLTGEALRWWVAALRHDPATGLRRLRNLRISPWTRSGRVSS